MRLRVVVVLASLAAATWIGTVPASAQAAQAAQAQPGGVRFSSPNMEIDEGSESIRVSVERTGALHVSRLIVDYASESGSARGGIDYADTAGTLSFEVGESFKSFAVRVRNDSEAEEREQFTVRLSNARDASTVGGPMTIAIWDDDTSPFDPEAAEVAASTSEATAVRRAAPRSAIAAPPVVAAPSTASDAIAGATARPAARPVTSARRASASTTRRQVSFLQSTVTPFELRPAGTGATANSVLPARVDPLLALLAGLLLARVAAEVWFRSRLDAT